MSRSVKGRFSRGQLISSSAADPAQPSYSSTYAKYIGRVGALALALGVGVAVATGSSIGVGAGVAYAQTEGDGAEGGGQGAGAGEGTGEGAGVDAGEAPGDLTPAEVPGEEQAGDGDAEPGEGSGSGNGAGVPEMNLNVGGDAQIKGQEEQGQDELGEGQGEGQGAEQAEDGNEGEGLTPSGTGTAAVEGNSGYAAPSGGNSPASGAPVAPSKPGPSSTGAESGQGLIDPSASRLGGGENKMSTFSLNTGPGQNLQFTTAATAAGTPAPAPLVRQPSNPIEAIVGGVAAVINIVSTAVTTFVSSILAPGPTTPAPPMMLFVVLGWAQRELQRTFLNQNPTAVVDATTTAEDTDIDIDVLANDIDPDINPGTDGNPYPGDRLTITDYTQPANGSVALNDDGTFTYTPNPDYYGTDTFTYTVSDEASPWHLHGLAGFFGGGGHTSTTTVTVNVTSVEDNTAPPVADNDAATVDEGGSVTINVLDGDTDPDGNATIDPTTVEIVTHPAKGSVTVDPVTGVVTYQSNGAEVTSDSFTYTVNDTGELTSNVATVNVTVNPVNDGPPVADNDAATVDEGGSVTINVLDGDTDPDGNATIDPTTVEIVTHPAKGSVTVDPVTGVVTYQSNGAEVTSDSFTYRVKDATGAWSNAATVNITISPVNDSPVADNDTATVDEGASVAINVLDGDTDPDGNTTIDKTTVEIVTPPAKGSVTIDPDTGVVTYQSNGAEVTSDSFTYRVKDATGAWSNAATVNITITPVDEPFDTATLNVGGSPTDIVITPDGKRAYVGNILGNTVTVLDVDPNSPTYNQVLDLNAAAPGVQGINVGAGPHTLAVTPDGKRLYVTHYTNQGGTTVTVVNIDTTSASYGQIIDTNASVGGVQKITVGSSPAGIAITPDGKRAYVANSNSASISVIDTDPTSSTYNQVLDADPTTAAVDSIAVPDGPFKVAVSADGKRIYVTSLTANRVSVIDIDPTSVNYHKVIDTDAAASGTNSIVVGGSPEGIAITPGINGARAYVVNPGLDTVSVIDVDPNSPTYNQVLDQNPAIAGVQGIAVGDNPTRVAISPDGKYALVTNLLSDNVTVIDIDRNSATYNKVVDIDPSTAAIDNVAVGDSPDGIAITPDGTRAYVTSNSDGTIRMIHLPAGDEVFEGEVGVVNIGGEPLYVAVKGDRLYVTHFSGGQQLGLTVIDLNTNTVIDTDENATGTQGVPDGMASAKPAIVGNRIYVPDYNTGVVTVIDLETNTVVDVDTDPDAEGSQPIDIGSGAVHVIAAGDRLYVTSEFGTVTVIDTVTNAEVDTDPTMSGTQSIDSGAGTFVGVVDGDRLYVANFGESSVSVIDLDANVRLDTITGAGINRPRGIAVVGDNIYVANDNGTVSVIDKNNYTAVDTNSAVEGTQPITVPGGGALIDMAVSGDRLYVATNAFSSGGNQVAVIDTTTNTVIDSITVGAGPWGLAVAGDRLYVANRYDGSVSIIDITPTPNVV